MIRFAASTAQEAMWNGFLPFGLCSIWGAWLAARGLRGDTARPPGTIGGSRWWLVIAGLALQAPLAGYLYFAWRQGLFAP